VDDAAAITATTVAAIALLIQDLDGGQRPPEPGDP
jgi:hypothetical protein